MRGFKFEPVRWMTATLVVLLAISGAQDTFHVLPESYTKWLLIAIAILTAILGKLTRDKVTPLAAPRTSSGRALELAEYVPTAPEVAPTV